MPLGSYQLPFHAIAYCLGEAGISLRDVDRIAYLYDPAITDPIGGAKAKEWSSGFGRWGDAFLAGIEAAPRLLRRRASPPRAAPRWHRELR